MGYSLWAIELANYYFGPHAAGQQVRLLVSREMLDSSFAHLSGAAGFLASVRNGPDWVVNLEDGIVARVEWLSVQWLRDRANRFPGYPDMPNNCPPHLPYLVLLSLAWTIEHEGIAAHNFYGRLETIYPHHNLNLNLANLENAWNDLCVWSTHETHGKFGEFHVEQLGEMGHVGIPRAQVIFTPNRLARLPELFYLCGLVAQNAANLGQVRNALLAHPAYSNAILGTALVNEIINETDIGNTAFNMICQALHEEEPFVPELGDFQGEGQENAQQNALGPTTGKLLLGLRLEDAGFHPFFTCSPADTFLVDSALRGMTNGQARFDSRNPVNPVLKYLDNNNPVLAADYAQQWTQGVSFPTTGNDGFQGNLRLSGRSIRFFQWRSNTTLVETKELPAEGAVYILYSDEHADLLNIWMNDHQQFIIQVPPVRVNGHHLICVNNTQNIPEADWLQLPGPVGNFGPGVSYISVTGGSRQARGTVRRPYLPYDLPIIVLSGDLDIELGVEGAKGELITDQNNANQAAAHDLPGSTIRYYEITNLQGPLVTLQALRGEEILNTKTIRIAAESDVAQVANEQVFFVDAQGRGPSQTGLRGTVLNAELELDAWEFDNAQPAYDPPNADHNNEDIIRSVAYQLLESYSQQPRLSYQEARRRAVDITEIESWQVVRLIRWLCNLGYLDIQYGYQGRWAYVYPSQPALYLPCYKQDNQFEAIVGGCTTINQLHNLITTGQEWGCEVRVVNRYLDPNFSWDKFPSRISLLNADIEVFEVLASEFNMQWNPEPPAWRIAHWAASHEEWATSLDWREGAVTHNNVNATYSPPLFSISPGFAARAPFDYAFYQLRPDEQERHNFYYQLEQAEQNGGMCNHAFVADRSCGLWKAHWSAMDFYLGVARQYGAENVPDTAPLLYEQNSTLTIPSQLVLPYNLARAVFLSSGLVPNVIDPCDAYRMPQYQFVPNQAYDGPCFQYENVHPCIANIVAQKLGVSLRAL